MISENSLKFLAYHTKSCFPSSLRKQMELLRINYVERLWNCNRSLSWQGILPNLVVGLFKKNLCLSFEGRQEKDFKFATIWLSLKLFSGTISWKRFVASWFEGSFDVSYWLDLFSNVSKMWVVETIWDIAKAFCLKACSQEMIRTSTKAPETHRKHISS